MFQSVLSRTEMGHSWRIGLCLNLRFVSVFMCYLLCCPSGWAFNLDTKSALLHNGPSGAMFGFAVSLHRDSGNSWLLVGAPSAQTDQPGVDRGGAVYRCSIDVANACQQIPFDRSGATEVTLRGRLEQTDNKTKQWFGATLHSSGENGIIVACAPRYVYYSTNLKRRDPVGTCWTSRSSFTGFQEYAPCRTSAWGYHRQGSCQAGFSAVVAKGGRRLYIGAVGSWYWQGQVFTQDLYNRQSLRSTYEAPEHDDDSFLGYSSATGEFSGDNDPDVVVGMPRGNNLTGKVVLFNSSLNNLHNITGEQMGSYFGYSLCVSDLNGDGLEDIVVGAPLYTDLKAKDGSYEKGRVYVIYQTKNHQFKKMSTLDGDESKGRFGMALASLKDINRDGFEDFAVGAPYAGSNGQGIVYIFHGSKEGVQPKSVQALQPSDFGDSSIKTFGFSLSGGMDVDNNEYSDLLIGAYDSDRAVFLRSRPVVTIKSSLKLDPEKISLDTKACSLKDGTLVSCVVVQLCLEYSGVSVDSDIGFFYQTKLDALKETPRVYFLLNETLHVTNTTIRLRKEAIYCNSFYIYFKRDIRDKLSPITIEVTYDLLDVVNPDQDLQPVLSTQTPNMLTKQVTIQKNCGKDNVCIPDLKLEVKPNMDQYLIGTKQRLELDVKIENLGEDAFESMVYLRMPLEVSYININKSKLDSPVSCSGGEPDRTGVNELVCDIGNPLPAGKVLNFKILLAPSKFTSGSTASDFTFSFEVNSTNEELKTTQKDNKQTIMLPVRVEVELVIGGNQNQERVFYNVSTKYPDIKNRPSDIGPEVTHIYQVDNRGLSLIKEAIVYLLWPTYTLEHDNLLYLLEQPYVTGNARCEEVTVNPLGVRVNKKVTPSGTTRISDLSSAKVQDKTVEPVVEENSSIGREKRMADEDDDELQEELVCGPTICTKIRCVVYNLKKGRPVTFTLKSSLWPDTVTKMSLAEVQISSKLVAKVTSLPYNINPAYLGIQKYRVNTLVYPEGLDQGYHSVPLWIILLAVCGGLLVLGLLALLLWRLGFFKRKRPQDEEPLHRPEKNGYQLAKGDAAL